MQPFSEQEKRQLLTEIVKHSQIDNHQLYRILGYFNVAPNWYHLALPNGRTLAQCQATLAMIGNEVAAQGTKRKAPGDGQNSECGNGVQPSGPHEHQAQPQPTAAQNPQMNVQHQSAMPTNPQQYQYQPGPPPKKKGRPAYAGRNAMGQQPFNPRALAPMPNQQIVQNGQPSFRPIAPAPQLHPSTITVVEPVVTSGMNQGLMCAPLGQQRGGVMKPHRRYAEMAGQRGGQQALAALSRLPGQVSDRPRSSSEAVPSVSKQEETEQDRSRSVEVIEAKEHIISDEDDTPDKVQQQKNGSPEPSKALRRSQRKV
ncbi:hypothetical protein FPOAC2_08031 [Fusarium poae]|uniref:hypothetical protein n=1 Tax=Fusarium poae TaxID=36050 RepID=UPI001CE7D097|nr:hypothetical protein FPOAC1_008111 [Fusarium poae]KAG8668727.1 hypothetical protein FPOAC1_008111 [Fusarium poae]